MARIRSIHPGLFTDEAFMSASACGRLMIIGIWCEAWDDGVFEWKPITLKAKIFPVDNVDTTEILAELERLSFVKKFTAGGKQFGAIRNFCKWQRPKKPNNSGVMTDELRTYVALSVAEPEPVRNQFGTSSENPPQMEDGGDSREEKEPLSETATPQSDERFIQPGLGLPEKPSKKPRNEYPGEFDKFWEAYPTDQLMSKKTAFDRWRRLSSDDREKALASLPAFHAYCRAHPNYRPVHACKFISDRRFDGFAAVAVEVQAVAGFYAKAETKQREAWDAYFREKTGKSLPSDARGGWMVPTEWPPSHSERVA